MDDSMDAPGAPVTVFGDMSFNMARCEESPLAKDTSEVGDPSGSCPLTDLTKQIWVEVDIRTRLGSIPLAGVKTTVAGVDFGPSNELGGFGPEDKPKRHRVGYSAFNIKAVYENADAHLMKEDIFIDVTELTRKGKVTATGSNKIDSIEDYAGEQYDLSFDEQYDLTGSGDYKFKSGVPETQDEPILHVTVYVATFSLDVPYLNQNYKHERLMTRVGDNKDPEPTPHKIERTADEEEWKGWVLCSPTSATMLSNYWRRIAGNPPDLTREAVLQQGYDIWAESGFDKRIDKKLYVGTSAANSAPGRNELVTGRTAPTSPSDEAYWLDSSGTTYKLYRYRLDYEDANAEDAEHVMARLKGTDPSPQTSYQAKIHQDDPLPLKASKGDFWVLDYTPTTTPMIRKIKDGPSWDYIEEGRWRVKKHGGSEIWKYGGTSSKVAKHYGPESATDKNGFPGGTKAIALSEVTGPPKTLEVIAKREAKNQKVPDTAYVSGVPVARPLGGEIGLGRVKLGWRTYDVEFPLSALKGFVDGYKTILSKGSPFITSTTATAGHVMIWRGAVVNVHEDIEWLIANDPYGNLNTHGSIILDDFDLSDPVGQYPVNLSDDVTLVQQALADLEFFDGEIDGEESDALYEAIYAFQKSKRYKRTRRMKPGDSTAKKLNVAINAAVGKVVKQGTNSPDDVKKLKEFLVLSGDLETNDATDPEVSEEMLKALIQFQAKKHVKKKAGSYPGYIGERSKNRDSSLETVMKKMSKGGYSKEEGSQNQSLTTTTDASKRGMHVYYRNATPGKDMMLRIKNESMGRVEDNLSEVEISKNLTPGV